MIILLLLMDNRRSLLPNLNCTQKKYSSYWIFKKNFFKDLGSITHILNIKYIRHRSFIMYTYVYHVAIWQNLNRPPPPFLVYIIIYHRRANELLFFPTLALRQYFSLSLSFSLSPSSVYCDNQRCSETINFLTLVQYFNFSVRCPIRARDIIAWETIDFADYSVFESRRFFRHYNNII